MQETAGDAGEQGVASKSSNGSAGSSGAQVVGPLVEALFQLSGEWGSVELLPLLLQQIMLLPGEEMLRRLGATVHALAIHLRTSRLAASMQQRRHRQLLQGPPKKAGALPAADSELLV